jgi:hypothetical protein
MTVEVFWQLIAEAKAASGGAKDDRAEALRRLLSLQEPREIVEFQRIYDTMMARAYTWDLWAAAYLLCGGCSDDGFEYFRDWLISMGHAAFETALRDPDALSGLKIHTSAEEEYNFEEFGYVAMEAYEEATGMELPRVDVPTPDEPTGTPWDEDDLPTRLPKMWAKFGNQLTG